MSEEHLINYPLELRHVMADDGQIGLARKQPHRDGWLRYDLKDPYAVTMVCACDWGMTCWTFSRDLLLAGLLGATGEGNVRVGVTGESDQVRFDLSSPVTMMTVDVVADSVRAFLRLTFDAIPNGSEGERMDLDYELAILTS